MGTLKDLMAADVTDVFLDAAEFADDTIVHYPQGNREAGVTVTGIFVQDRLEGTRELPGDGVAVDTQFGRRLHETGILELSTAVRVGCNREPVDQFKIQGQIWFAVRISSEDDDMQSVVVSRTEKVDTRREQKRR